MREDFGDAVDVTFRGVDGGVAGATPEATPGATAEGVASGVHGVGGVSSEESWFDLYLPPSPYQLHLEAITDVERLWLVI